MPNSRLTGHLEFSRSQSSFITCEDVKRKFCRLTVCSSVSVDLKQHDLRLLVRPIWNMWITYDGGMGFEIEVVLGGSGFWVMGT